MIPVPPPNVHREEQALCDNYIALARAVLALAVRDALALRYPQCDQKHIRAWTTMENQNRPMDKDQTRAFVARERKELERYLATQGKGLAEWIGAETLTRLAQRPLTPNAYHRYYWFVRIPRMLDKCRTTRTQERRTCSECGTELYRHNTIGLCKSCYMQTRNPARRRYEHR